MAHTQSAKASATAWHATAATLGAHISLNTAPFGLVLGALGSWQSGASIWAGASFWRCVWGPHRTLLGFLGTPARRRQNNLQPGASKTHSCVLRMSALDHLLSPEPASHARANKRKCENQITITSRLTIPAVRHCGSTCCSHSQALWPAHTSSS